MTRTVTSVSVDEELWEEARIFAIKKRITVSELLELALESFMKNPQQGSIERAAASSAQQRSNAAKKAWRTRRSDESND